MTIEAVPLPESPEAPDTAGAFVNVYTTAASEDRALQVANSEIREAGWQATLIDNIAWVTRSEAAQLPETLPYFEQALVDGVVLVFHTYPHGGEEPSVLH